MEPVLIESNQKRFMRKKVCHMDSCGSRSMFMQRRSKGDFSEPFPPKLKDRDGYTYCNWCKRIWVQTVLQRLVECPECGYYFKGFNLSPKIDYECDHCG